MSAPLTVAILAGGLTHEREVSLHSGRRVAAALREAGMYVKIFDVDANLLQRLHSMAPDIVRPLIHGSTGEDGSLQDLLELAGHPYVGTDPASCKLASDKAIAAAVLAREGVAMPDSVTIPQKLFREVGVAPILDLIKARFGFPLVVKPSQGGSALGVTIVEESAALPGAMVDCYAYGEDARIEKYIDGREVAVAVMERATESSSAEPPSTVPSSSATSSALAESLSPTGSPSPAVPSPSTAATSAPSPSAASDPAATYEQASFCRAPTSRTGEPHALPPVEIVTDGPYDFDARYNAGRSEYFVPARLTDEETSTVKSTAERVHRILGLRHLSRTDIVLDGDGVPWVLDVNVAPGMTETSLFPQAAAAEARNLGITVDDLYTKILRSAMDR